MVFRLVSLLVSIALAQWQQHDKKYTKDRRLYDILDIMNAEGATPELIKSQFKKFAIRYHPDKNREDPETAKQNFQDVSLAYDILGDPEKKSVYDMYGEAGVQDFELWQGTFHDKYRTYQSQEQQYYQQ